MIKRLLALDGVQAVVQFRDDGSCGEGYGFLEEVVLHKLCRFASSYQRLTQANADQLSMFTQQQGWAPPRGWSVRGRDMSVCVLGDLVCLLENERGSVTQVFDEMAKVLYD